MPNDANGDVVAAGEDCVHAYVRGDWYGVRCATDVTLDGVADRVLRRTVDELHFFHTNGPDLDAPTVSKLLGFGDGDELPGPILLVEGRGPSTPQPAGDVRHILVGGFDRTRVPLLVGAQERTVDGALVRECLFRLNDDRTLVRPSRLLVGSSYPGLVARYDVGGENGPSPKI